MATNFEHDATDGKTPTPAPASDQEELKTEQEQDKEDGIINVDPPTVRKKTVDKLSKSGSSRGSNLSTGSQKLLMTQKAKMAAARTRLKYVEEELEIKKQQALLEANLTLIKHRKEASEAEAEFNAMKELVYEESDLSSEEDMSQIKQERTQDFIEKASSYYGEIPQLTPLTNLVPRTRQTEEMPRESGNVPVHTPYVQPVIRQYTTGIGTPSILSANHENLPNRQVRSVLNPGATPFQPVPMIPTNQPQGTAFTDITKLMIKKELMFSRLTKFNDKPEFFSSWKSSFKDVISDLALTPLEEIDLLIKWLGPDSSKQALSMKTANAGNIPQGLTRIWERLNDRFASPEMVEFAIKNKLASFPPITYKENKRLYELCDIVSEIESIKEDIKYKTLFSYFDCSTGVSPIVSKLPYSFQEKWTREAVKYKKRHTVSYPPFSHFAEFLRELAKIKNDPSFLYENTSPRVNREEKQRSSTSFEKKTHVLAKKTVTQSESQCSETTPHVSCPLHGTGHTLNKCKTFRMKPIKERKNFLFKNGICFKCCGPKSHLAKDCQAKICCYICKSDYHPTALHENTDYSSNWRTFDHGGESSVNASCQTEPKVENVSSNCTELNDAQFKGKSCAKAVLVNIYQEGSDKSLQTYALIDDQSNKSLAKTEFFDYFQEQGDEIEYALSSCAGQFISTGRRTQVQYIIEAADRSIAMNLPKLIECNDIPNNRSEIPTPEVCTLYPHLQDVDIPPLNNEADILLLIGRDLLEAHHVKDQRIGPLGIPFAQRLPLGWVVIGEVCVGDAHLTDHVNVNKTFILQNERPSIFEPCGNAFKLKDDISESSWNMLGNSVFQRTKGDNKLGMSVEDKQFLQIVDSEITKNSAGNWVAPLPLRKDRVTMPSNRESAFKRAKSLEFSLKKNPQKKEQFCEFMQNIFDNHHAEIAPPLKEGEEHWYLPLFGVFHPKKPQQIRVVFDSSAKHQGVSLNNILLTGPDFTNSLLSILLRFRMEAVAVTVDIQQMFFGFYVKEEHRNFLRFFWYTDNDINKPLIEYRMCVHVFGNSPSPAIATYGLRKSAQNAKDEFGEDVCDFITNNFYVDDGLLSLPSSDKAIDIVKRTQKALLKEGNLRVHKIASNSKSVMEAFPAEDLAKDFKELNLGVDNPPLQRSLGICWDVATDTFTFKVSPEIKPFTRRGLLSTVNSLYDPLGFAAPVVIQGKLFLRNWISGNEWDDPLPVAHTDAWNSWRESLSSLEELRIKITYATSLKTPYEMHVFCDASKEAIAASSYLKTTDPEGQIQISFILGKAKVAPQHGHTIPRLELCAAVMAVEIAEIVCESLDCDLNLVKFYTDSQVVLGYISNETRRFYVYVEHRVNRIRSSTNPLQWYYVNTDCNPADEGTRPIVASRLQDSKWLKGPSFLHESFNSEIKTFPLIDEEQDLELQPEVCVKKEHILVTETNSNLGTERFDRFSTWEQLIRAIMLLKKFLRNRSTKDMEKISRISSCQSKDIDLFKESENFIIKQIQQSFYSKEIHHLVNKTSIPKGSNIISLSPILDESGILRVGGRLTKSDLSMEQKNPIIIPGRSHIAKLLVLYYHSKVQHQGRHFTEGSIRSHGYWITGAKRLVSSLIHGCVTCRKLRGKFQFQKMSDLPEDRLTPNPPFSYVGVDVFGPWSVVSRRTRGGQASSKRWAVLFSCLTSRAIHIELIEEMSSSSFINSLRRFVAIRGPVKQFRSDRGTNFVGSVKDLQINAINVADGPVADYIFKQGVTWKFNSPHSSHMGGVWERMIGVARRILDAMLLQQNCRNITHDVLSTLMYEVSAIVNARPIMVISSDPKSPSVLSPSVLLTQKFANSDNAFSHLDLKDAYRSQWKFVQVLSNMFWSKWKREYLQTLQSRQKWHQENRNVTVGDVVLLKDSTASRNDWPMGIITNVYPSDDNIVRKVEVRIKKDGKNTLYIRPITELILLLESEICD